MKKLLVFVLVVSLLAFASSSFAATYDYDTIDDVVGHWTGTDSDLAGHINSTYGSDAYNKYLAEKAANLLQLLLQELKLLFQVIRQ